MSRAGPALSPPTMGRRLYRGLVFALMVGAAGAMVSSVPGLFLQSVFVGEAQRCLDAQRKEVAVSGEVSTNCGEAIDEAPVWLPVVMIVAGGAVGLAGGFGYGFFQPSLRGRAPQREEAWLPF